MGSQALSRRSSRDFKRLELPLAIFNADPPSIELHLVSALQQFALLETHLAAEHGSFLAA